jgi:hypothetical protein
MLFPSQDATTSAEWNADGTAQEEHLLPRTTALHAVATVCVSRAKSNVMTTTLFLVTVAPTHVPLSLDGTSTALHVPVQ